MIISESWHKSISENVAHYEKKTQIILTFMKISEQITKPNIQEIPVS